MNVSQSALKELEKILNSEGMPAAGIRIFTQLGCCGPAIQMSIAENPSPGDLQISFDSVIFFIEEAANDIMAEVTLDYGPGGFRLIGLKRSGGGC